MTLRYRVDGREFLERRSRASGVLARILGGETFDAAEVLRAWQTIVEELPEIPFEPGRRYRIRCVAGKAEVRHVHITNEETGATYGADLPAEVEPTYQDLELIFLQRVRRPPAPGSSLLFAMDDGRTAMLGDLDVLEADEL